MAQASLAQQEAALHVLLNGTVSEVTQHMADFQTDSARSDFMQAKLHLMCVTLRLFAMNMPAAVILTALHALQHAV